MCISKDICRTQEWLFFQCQGLKLCPFDFFFFFHFFPKNYCSPNNDNVWDNFMILYRNVYRVKIMCCVNYGCFLFLGYGPLTVFYAYFV